MASEIPVFSVRIDGVDLPIDAKEAVDLVVVEDDLEMASSLCLQLDDKDSAFTDSPLFSPGKGIEVDMGYMGQSPIRVFAGEIVRLEAVFKEKGAQEAHLFAFDRGHRLKRTLHTRSFQKMTDTAIVQKIAAEEGLSTSCDATSEVFDYVFQNNETNLSFLCGRAQRIGFDLAVNDRSISFTKSARDQSPTVELKWGNNLYSFHPRLSISQVPTEVEVRSWDGTRHKLLVGRAKMADLGFSMSSAQLAGDTAEEAFGEAREVVVSRPVQDQAEAECLARSYLERMARSFVLAGGSCRGDPRILGGKTLHISGVGKRFSGPYAIGKAVHELSPTGYTTSFWGRRIGQGESYPAKPDPLPPRRKKPPTQKTKVRSFFDFTLQDQSGESLAGQKALLVDHKTQKTEQIELDAAGRFRREQLEPGSFSVQFPQIRKAAFDRSRLRRFDVYQVEKKEGESLRAVAARFGMTEEELLDFDGSTGIANRHRLPQSREGKLPAGTSLIAPKKGAPDPLVLEADLVGVAAGTPAKVQLFEEFREGPGEAIEEWDTEVGEEGRVRVEWDAKAGEHFVPAYVFKLRLDGMILTSAPLKVDLGPGVPKLAGQGSDSGIAGGEAAGEQVAVVMAKLLDKFGQPLAHQPCILIDESGRKAAEAVSDEDGYFLATQPGEGDFELRLVDAETPEGLSTSPDCLLPAGATRAQDGVHHVVLQVFERESMTPLVGERYTLRFPDGEITEGSTGAKALIVRHSVKPGTCVLEILGEELPVPTVEDCDGGAEPVADKIPCEPYPVLVRKPSDDFAERPERLIAPKLFGLLLRKPPSLGFPLRQKFTPNRSLRKGGVEHVLLASSGDLSHQALAARIRDPSSRFSAHYSVGKDGEVHRYVRERDKAWFAYRKRHQGESVDDRSVSVVLEGDGSTEDYPEPQLISLARLSHKVLGAVGLPQSAIKAANTVVPSVAGPGSRFDWQRFFARLSQLSGNPGK